MTAKEKTNHLTNMSYNPNIPINGDLIDADELRSQFNGLKDLIDLVPSGTKERFCRP